MTKRTRNLAMSLVAAGAAALTAAALFRGLGPELVRYLRIRRM